MGDSVRALGKKHVASATHLGDEGDLGGTVDTTVVVVHEADSDAHETHIENSAWRQPRGDQRPWASGSHAGGLRAALVFIRRANTNWTLSLELRMATGGSICQPQSHSPFGLSTSITTRAWRTWNGIVMVMSSVPMRPKAAICSMA